MTTQYWVVSANGDWSTIPPDALGAAAMLALTPSQLSAFSALGYGLSVVDSPADLEALSLAQIGGLALEGVSSIAATGSVVLTIAEAVAYAESGYSIKVPAGATVTIADTAANIAAITQTQANALSAAGYTSIASSNGPVTLTLAEALILSKDGLKVTGGAVTIADQASAFLSLTSQEAEALTAAGYVLTVIDSPNDLDSLTPGEIATLQTDGVSPIGSSGPIVLSIADAVADANAGLTIQVPQGDTLTVADTAADIAAISQSQANALKAAGYTSIASTNGAVTLGTAAALILQGDGLKVTGGAVTVADHASNLLALTSTQSKALLALGEKLTVLDSGADIALLPAVQIAALESEGVTAITATSPVGLTIANAFAFQQAGFAINMVAGDEVSIADTAANIEQLTTTEMANLGAVGISSLTATDFGVNLTLAQALAFQNAKLTLSAPTGDSVAVVDTVADLGGALTTTEIGDLPGLGVSRITVSNGNLTLTAAQTAAINANDLMVTASNPYTLTETAQANETFVFQPGFGQSALNGFDATGASNEVLQFGVADFSYLSAGNSAATDLAAIIMQGGIAQIGANTQISDTHGDALTLTGVSATTLETHAGNFAFK